MCINVGQAGVQIGNACWELFALEHGLDKTGKVVAEKDEEASVTTFFDETDGARYVPRTIFVDLDPSTIGKHIIHWGPFGWDVSPFGFQQFPFVHSFRQAKKA